MFSSWWPWASGREVKDTQRPNASPLHVRSVSNPVSPARGPGLAWQESQASDAGFSEDMPLQWTGSMGNKLFVQLLDDLDDLSSNSPSAHRRRRAREIFSEWLFSTDLRSPADSPSDLQRDHPFRRSSAADFGPTTRNDMAQKSDSQMLRRCSGDFSYVTHDQVSPERHHMVSRRSLDERRQSEPLSLISSETESDSGYHTGSGNVVKHTPGERTLTREDLRRRISVFNSNNHGLLMEPPSAESTTFQGSIRVLMNLIRPISMCISVQPPAPCDITSTMRYEPSARSDAQVTTFYLPKDTTKVIHISSTTTSQEVIHVLLAKYHIVDNPRKFALYEKTVLPDRTVKLRRISVDELPLQICLSWTCETVESLDNNQFVLQENDTGEILWDAFSLPELETFLAILNREEEEYVDQVRSKYRVLKIHMRKRLQSLEAKAENASADRGDKRTPVFV